METVLYSAITALPCNLLILFLFWDFDWRSRRTAIALILLNMTLKCFAEAVLVPLLPAARMRTVEFVFSVTGSIVYLACLRISLSQYLFTYVMVLDYLIIARGVASFAAVRGFGMDAQSWMGSLLCVVFYILTLPLLLHRLKRFAREVYRTDAPKLWNTIWIAPTLSSMVVAFYTNAFDQNTIDDWSELIARVSLLVAVLFVCFVLVQSLQSVRREAALQEQARQTEYILDLQRIQYDQLHKRMEETRRARHDLRQHLQLIRAFAESGDRQGLREYLASYGASLPPDDSVGPCSGNYVLDAVLRYYAERMLEAGVTPELQIDLPEEPGTALSDLCVVAGSLLGNALALCRDQEEPFVRLSVSGDQAGVLSLRVESSAAAPPSGGPDAALRAVEGIAARCGGTADFHWQDGVFTARVTLCPQERTEG